MKLDATIDPISRERRIVVTLTDADLTRVRLDRTDRWVLDDCNAPDATIADRLLGLQLLALRIEQSGGGGTC